MTRDEIEAVLRQAKEERAGGVVVDEPLIPFESSEFWTMGPHSGAIHVWPSRESGHMATIAGECACQPEVRNWGEYYLFRHHAFDASYPPVEPPVPD